VTNSWELPNISWNCIPNFYSRVLIALWHVERVEVIIHRIDRKYGEYFVIRIGSPQYCCNLQLIELFLFWRRNLLHFLRWLMLGSHCRFSSIDSECHRQNEECRQVQTKTPRANKVDKSLVDEVEHVLLRVDFCR